jgi:hypothetical protein
MTNADRIRAMTDDQIAEMLSNSPCPVSEHGCNNCYTFKSNCKQCWLYWLKQEVEHDER